MLKFLDKLLKGRTPAAAPSSAPHAAPAAVPVAPAGADAAAFDDLMDLLLGHLPPEEHERLRDTCAGLLRDDGGDPGLEPGLAVLEGLNGNDGQDRAHWVFMQVDWKASDEVEWQARGIAAGHGLADDFRFDVEAVSAASVLDVLNAYDRWLRPQDACFVFLDIDADAYYGFVVSRTIEAAVLQQAARAGVPMRGHADFRRAQGEDG